MIVATNNPTAMKSSAQIMIENEDATMKAVGWTMQASVPDASPVECERAAPLKAEHLYPGCFPDPMARAMGARMAEPRVGRLASRPQKLVIAHFIYYVKLISCGAASVFRCFAQNFRCFVLHTKPSQMTIGTPTCNTTLMSKGE